MHELCTLWGLDKSRTTPYRPSANGVCERINRTLADCLRTLIRPDDPTDNWDLLLPQLMAILRAAPTVSQERRPTF